MAAGAPRVFVSHLAGTAVFDPNGDQVGRVRDVVALLGGRRRLPSVLGLVVEVVSRRRVFLPMTRVTGVESGQVITTGVLNIRRFERRPNERLVLGELLDRQVTLVETGEEVTVLDVGLQRLPARRDWEIDRLFVRKGRKGGGLRSRRGEALTVEWDAVTGFNLEEPEQGTANLLATFEQLRPADLANVLHHLSEKRRAEVAAALHDDRLADVLEELPDDDQVEIINKLADERAALVLEAMDPDDAADLLGELPEDDKERLLDLMQPQEAAPVRRLLSYEEGTAGSLMTTEPIVLRPDASVAEALARVRLEDLPAPLASQVYVCRPPDETPTGKYLGVVHFQRLLREPPFALVGALVDADLRPLPPTASVPALTSYLAAYNIVSAPVVDEGGHLLGAVTVDDVLDDLLPEGWREAAAEGGLPGFVPGPHERPEAPAAPGGAARGPDGREPEDG
ncbi:magnesium transporter MgtE N-terminal domain-containing protein [Streptomyces qinglanensis]|uniref:Mg/Co/Ni transporter MgtE (Contains CBS domain) n=1 Tax=Streptomyces qinglanensis TaxID=943816 RepID=A0A1H9UTV0_9ACTN|nr:CBS domain-containing protein [Streptomyces qinglanensis]SES12574.1 Mg/Co/Ni transporter MgtE (contains CBS domain) [Streptomyces qinglanensis]